MCKYCENKETISIDYAQCIEDRSSIKIHDAILSIELCQTFWHDLVYAEADVNIFYCPMCGRKLKKE